MKPVLLFVLEGCPYCKRTLKDLAELQKEERFKDIEITMIDEAEQPEYANQFDYYHVPTFYVDGVKRKEGVLTKQDVQDVLEEAIL